MSQRTKTKRPNRLLIFFSMLLFILIIDACRKIDRVLEKPIVDSDPAVIADKFFTLPINTHPTIKAIAASMKKQNDSLHFAANLIKTIGYPRWDKAWLLTNSQNNIIRPEGGEEPEDTTQLYIPFTLGNSTSAVLTVAINFFSQRDTAYNLMYPSHYKNYGFDTTLPRASWNARHVFQMFTEFDYDIFGVDTFLVTDGRIFGHDEEDSFYLRRSIPGGLGGSDERDDMSVETIMSTVCIDYLPVFYTEAIATEVLIVSGPVAHCTNFWIQNPADPGPLAPIAGGGGGGNPVGLFDLVLINPCPVTESIGTEDGQPCNTGYLPINFNPFANYEAWGYHHFETWDLSPEDIETANDWGQNNIDTAGLDPCVRGILDDLLGGTSLLGRILTKIDRAANRPSDIEKYYLKFRTGPLPRGLGALTKTGSLNPANGIYSDTIIINSNGVLDSSTQVAMARNIIHEVMHAYINSIFKRHYNFANPELVPQETIWDNYVDTLVAIQTRDSLYKWYISDPAGDFDHNYMAEKLLEIMAKAVASVDDYRNSDEFYWALCWGGLFGTRPMQQAWPNYPSWPPTAGYPAPSNDSTRGLKYALTEARLDSIWRWSSRERYDTAKAKGRKRQSIGCYGN